MVPYVVLIVDDNLLNLKLTRMILDSEGFNVITVADQTQMFDALERTCPDLILMDLELPGSDGFELTWRLKADPKYQDIVVFAYTAHAMAGDRERALRAGFDGFITKPVDTRTLPRMIFDTLEGRRILAENAAEQQQSGAGSHASSNNSVRAEFKFVLPMFVADSKDLVRQLDTLIRSQDAPAARRIAHGLTGNCLILGLAGMAALCGKIENLCRERRLADAQAITQELAMERDDLLQVHQTE